MEFLGRSGYWYHGWSFNFISIPLFFYFAFVEQVLCVKLFRRRKLFFSDFFIVVWVLIIIQIVSWSHRTNTFLRVPFLCLLVRQCNLRSYTLHFDGEPEGSGRKGEWKGFCWGNGRDGEGTTVPLSYVLSLFVEFSPSFWQMLRNARGPWPHNFIFTCWFCSCTQRKSLILAVFQIALFRWVGVICFVPIFPHIALRQ